MNMSQKDMRILKLFRKGMKPPAIAGKIGYGGANMQAGIERVKEALKKAGIPDKETL